MRKTGIPDLVLFNRALIAEAEAACAQFREIRLGSLLLTAERLMSGAMTPPWGRDQYPHYWNLADRAFALGMQHWRSVTAECSASIDAARQSQEPAAAGLQLRRSGET